MRKKAVKATDVKIEIPVEVLTSDGIIVEAKTDGVVRWSDTEKYKRNTAYLKEHHTQIKLSVPNAEADRLAAYCKAINTKKATFIRQAIQEKMERDSMAKPIVIEVNTNKLMRNGIRVLGVNSLPASVLKAKGGKILKAGKPNKVEVKRV